MRDKVALLGVLLGLACYPGCHRMDTPVGPGDVLLGKYRIEKVLGKGGMGIVVAAHHVDLGQRYAIKFLLPTVLAHDEAVTRFLREARASARLQSEHVARVHDVGYMDSGAPYMVMEYLEGSDLKELIKKDGPLPAELAMVYMRQVCDAIAEAHAAGIVHRDLKPANLFLVYRRNGTPCVKVLDFGISKHLGTDEVDLTSTNATLGSPLYMSPEQISKSKSVDTRTDIWALGVIFYELLTGICPFRGGTVLEVVSRILQEDPTPVRQFRPDVPEHAEAVIARCLRKRREERFQTVEELLMALEKGTLTPHHIPLNATTTSPMPPYSNIQGFAHSTPTPTVPATSTDPTNVSFGQTQAPKAKSPTNPLALAVAAGVSVVVLGGGVFGLREWMTSKDAPEASDIAAASRATPEMTSLPALASSVAPAASNLAEHTEMPKDAGIGDSAAADIPTVIVTPEARKPAPTPMATSTSTHDSGTTTTTKKKRKVF